MNSFCFNVNWFIFKCIWCVILFILFKFCAFKVAKIQVITSKHNFMNMMICKLATMDMTIRRHWSALWIMKFVSMDMHSR